MGIHRQKGYRNFMTRRMVDVTHDGLPDAINTIRQIGTSGLVAVYDTGSADIAATPADLAELPAGMPVVMIDQGFTGSPNMHANIRDCENGGWLLNKAVDRSGWDVARPTLYLGYPDTTMEAYDAGWRGDVWLVGPSLVPPATPPTVPPGLTVVAVQWDYGPDFDISAVFDPYWPEAKPMPDPTFPFNQTDWRHCGKCSGLFYAGDSTTLQRGVCPAGGTHDGTGSGDYAITDTAP